MNSNYLFCFDRLADSELIDAWSRRIPSCSNPCSGCGGCLGPKLAANWSSQHVAALPE